MVIGGRRLYDGGVSEVIPVSLARDMAGEAGVVLAVDCNGGTRWPSADSFVAVALRAGLTLLRGRSRNELAGADVVIAPSMGESGWMRPVKIPSFFKAGLEALDEALPEMRRLLAGAAAAKAKSA
jgi:predicted acylesterase/phospholipase RssA